MGTGVGAPVAAGLATGIEFVILFALTANSIGTNNAIDAQVPGVNVGAGIANTCGPDDVLSQGGRVVTIPTINITQFDVARGSTVEIPLTVSYVSNATGNSDGDLELTMPYKGLNGIQYLGKDNLPIDTKSIVTVSPSMIEIILSLSFRIA